MSKITAIDKTKDDPQKANILLVDDNPNNLLALEALLENLGHNLVKAKSGRAALKCLLDREFALILLDVQMPDMDGFETAELIRERQKSHQTPIIFITAISKSQKFIFKGYSCGAVDYLVKPIEPQILLSKVAFFINQYQSMKEVKAQTLQHKMLNQKLIKQLEKTTYLNRKHQINNKELEAFNSRVCHDLRNPLASIKGYNDLLMKYSNSKLSPKEQHYLKQIETASKRMSELIEDLFNLSLTSQGDIEYETVNMSLIAQQIAFKLYQTEPERKIEFNIALKANAQGDPRLLKIVLENLLFNAWKYTKNQTNPQIEFGFIDNVFFVRDNGAGFNMADAKKLFAPFQRLHDKNEFEGTGVGLATVQSIIRRHGGEIWAESVVNQGATFYFTLAATSCRIKNKPENATFSFG